MKNTISMANPQAKYYEESVRLPAYTKVLIMDAIDGAFIYGKVQEATKVFNRLNGLGQSYWWDYILSVYGEID